MNKSDLISAVEADAGISRKDAAAAVDAVFSGIARSLGKGESVTVTGFGVFERRQRAARKARNPRTGETLKIRARKVAVFRPGTRLKEITAGAKLPKTGNVLSRAVTVAAPAKPVAKKAPAKAALVKKAAPKTVAKKAPAKAAPVKAAPAKKAAPVKPAVKAAPKASAKKTAKRGKK